jgi:hypothetical protein
MYGFPLTIYLVSGWCAPAVGRAASALARAAKSSALR